MINEKLFKNQQEKMEKFGRNVDMSEHGERGSTKEGGMA